MTQAQQRDPVRISRKVKRRLSSEHAEENGTGWPAHLHSSRPGVCCTCKRVMSVKRGENKSAQPRRRNPDSLTLVRARLRLAMLMAHAVLRFAVDRPSTLLRQRAGGILHTPTRIRAGVGSDGNLREEQRRRGQGADQSTRCPFHFERRVCKLRIPQVAGSMQGFRPFNCKPRFRFSG